MKFTNDQIQTLMQFHIRGLEWEFPTTKKVVAAIPEGQSTYKPDPKSKSAFELAWHICSSEVWFLNSIADGEFRGEEGDPKPSQITSVSSILSWYDSNFPAALERVKSLPIEKACKEISFFGIFNHPAALYLSFCLNHSIHHRGQLSAYLRAMGSKVPSIYGGSADEPFMPK